LQYCFIKHSFNFLFGQLNIFLTPYLTLWNFTTIHRNNTYKKGHLRISTSSFLYFVDIQMVRGYVAVLQVTTPTLLLVAICQSLNQPCMTLT